MPDESTHPEEIDPPARPRNPSCAPSGKVPDVTGVVLAGGRSRRYGRNKALVPFDGVPLIERVVSILEQVFHKVILSANELDAYRYLGLPIISDVYSGVGPLAGVHASLSALSDTSGFFVACDMPFLNPTLIRHMARLFPNAEAVVPRVGSNVEPLHAVYRKGCIDAVERAIQRGERGIVSFYPDIRIRYVEESEIRVFEPNLDAFVNVNRPDELRLFMEHLHEKRERGHRE